MRRAASLAGVPLGTGARFAGAAARTALGANKALVYDAATAASVDAAVATLARIKGPAMKFGQSLAVFSGALPPDLAAKFVALEQLYESAEPHAWSKVSPLLSAVPAGRLEVDPECVAAASLGQVHRGTWTDPATGERTAVAVKLRYPEAPRAAKSDMAQLRALLPLVGRLLPTIDLRALLDEHAERLVEELDYRNEARWMERFVQAWAGDDVVVPTVLHASESVLVSTWMDGRPLSELIASADDETTRAERDQAGTLLTRFCFASPSRVGAMHADPHPGNYRLLPDGRLGVLDFGSVADGAGLFTRMFVSTAFFAQSGEYDELRRVWVDSGMASDDITVEQLVDLLDIDVTGQTPTPYSEPTFTFDPSWLEPSAEKWGNPGAALNGAKLVRFPPAYLLEHRAVMGTFALLTGLRATVPVREVFDDAIGALGLT